MTARAPSLILTLSLLPALAACGSSGKDADPPPPLSSEAMAAVVEKPGVSRERLARAVDALAVAALSAAAAKSRRSNKRP